MVGISHWLGVFLPIMDFTDKIVIGWLCVTEVISILENLAACNVPLPSFIINKLQSVKQQFDQTDERA